MSDRPTADRAASGRVLAVDAQARVRQRLRELYRAKGYSVRSVPAGGPEALCDPGDGLPQPLDAIVLEYPQRAGRGAAVLRAALECRPRPAVLALCPHGMLEAALLALKEGADDFLLAPFDADELEIKLDRAIQRRGERAELELLRRGRPSAAARHILGSSRGMRGVRRQVERVAPGGDPVLVAGEPGTGKGLVAAVIHDGSPRRARPFLRVNCAALPDALLESELFGHEPGAFTGADRRRGGRLEEADGGTLLLDEIGDLHLRTQAKILRALQDGEFERLGGTRPIRVDVRILAGTSRDLGERIAAGRFREDLFFRLQLVSVELPPLRERGEDIPQLAEHFFAKFDAEMPRRKCGFSPEALAALEGHPWPGNVRELRNAVERAVLIGASPWIGVDDLALGPRGVGEAPRPDDALLVLPENGIDYREVERALLLQALERADWVQKEAARLLQMSRRQLNYRIRRLGITHPRWRRNCPVARAPEGSACRPRRPGRS